MTILHYDKISLNLEVVREQVVGISVHGTGTPLGDPIEVGALAQVMSRKANDSVQSASAPVPAMLSNKSCFGHTEGAAGEKMINTWPPPAENVPPAGDTSQVVAFSKNRTTESAKMQRPTRSCLA